MVEFDRNLKGICDMINQCYSKLFPNHPNSPAFTFSRAMTTIWKAKVFDKLKDKLFASFRDILNLERRKQATEKAISEEEMTDFFNEPKNFMLLNKFVQAVTDISINEISVHMIGSSKFVPDETYSQLEDIILSDTMYLNI